MMMLSTPEFTFSDLSLAFDISGIPVVDPSVEFDENHRRRIHPLFHPEYDSNHLANVTFRAGRNFIAAHDNDAVQSRKSNVHFDRPKTTAFLACHFAALGCPPPTRDHLNLLKMDGEPVDYCFESRALRRLLLGLSPRLLAVRLLYEASWMGSPTRLRALLDARSDRIGEPIWDVAVHIRVGFRFVEVGETEAQNAATVAEWLRRPAIARTLDEVVAQVRARLHSRGGRRPAVYVASETALVRQHVAQLIANATRPQGPGGGAEVDYFAFSGTPHPVDINGNHRSDAGHDEHTVDPKAQADLLFPYLEWWALAHSRSILVRRGLDLKPSGSTFSGTAHWFGGWAEH